jgi:hypothetical protein
MRRLVARLFLVVVLAGITVTPVMLKAMPCTCQDDQECNGECSCFGQDSVIFCGCTSCG